MSEPESIKNICRNLVDRYRANKLGTHRDIITLAQLSEDILTIHEIPIEDQFDLFLTDEDREFLALLKVMA